MDTMLSNHQKIIMISCGVIWIGFLLVMPEKAFSQDGSAAPRKLVVGTMVAPPLSVKTPDGQWEGYSIEIWQGVAQYLGIPFEFREYSNIGSILEAINKREIDIIPSLPVEARYEPTMDFSQSYLKSGLSIAAPAEGFDFKLFSVVNSLFSREILEAIGLLILISVVAGTIVWAFERRRNSEMFGNGTVKGIGHGIWWSMVTMTTVGYGDKAPKTLGGRMVAFIWMLFSVVFIAILTANITTSLTISELRGKVRGFNDLYNVRVGSLSQSEGFYYLTKQGVAVMPFDNLQEGLTALSGKKIDAFVSNEIILKYLIKHEFPGKLQVVPGTFDEYFVSIALQDKSPLRKPINAALLQFMGTEKWAELHNRYDN